MKINNTKLMFVFLTFTLIYVGILYFDSNDDRSFSKDLIDFDKEQIDKISIYPRSENQNEIIFQKIDSINWSVSQDNIESHININNIKRIIDEVSLIKPNKVATTKTEKWEQYQVTDSLATRVVFYSEGKEVLDLFMGKFTIRQRKPQPGMSPQMMQRQQNNITGVNYFRVAGDDKVYSTDGMISMSINQKFNDWRNQSIIVVPKEDITEITIKSDNIGINMKRIEMKETNGNWDVRGIELDSLGIDIFLTAISNLKSSEFDDNFINNNYNELSIEIKRNDSDNINVICFDINEEEYIVKSNMNEGTFLKLKKDKLDFIFSKEDSEE